MTPEQLRELADILDGFPTDEPRRRAATYLREQAEAMESGAVALWEDADDAETAELLRDLLKREPSLKEVTAFQKRAAALFAHPAPQSVPERRYPLPDDLYDSKDWRAADYAGRVEWLHAMYESKKREADTAFGLASQPVPEGVQAKVIAGALYDFAGYLTTRDEAVTFGASREAAPAADLLVQWARMRGLSLDDPLIYTWNAAISTTTAPSPCIGNNPACPCQDGDICHYVDGPDGTKAMPIPAAPVPADVVEALRDLVIALDATTWSSWQTTARFADSLERARAALAAARRPRQPMTGAEISAAWSEAYGGCSETPEWFAAGVRAAERHHGIAAADQEGK